VGKKPRLFVAEKVSRSHWQIVVFPFKSHLYKVLPAGATQGSRMGDRPAPGTLSSAVGNQCATLWIEAHGHVVDAVEEGMELRSEPWRAVIVTYASHQQVGLNFPSNAVWISRFSLGDPFLQVFDCFSEGVRLGEELFQGANNPVSRKHR